MKHTFRILTGGAVAAAVAIAFSAVPASAQGFGSGSGGGGGSASGAPSGWRWRRRRQRGLERIERRRRWLELGRQRLLGRLHPERRLLVRREQRRPIERTNRRLGLHRAE